MRTALETLAMLAAAALLLAPLFALAKDQKKAEIHGNRLVEKIKEKPHGKETNEVWRTGHTFPLMFARPQPKAYKKGKK